MRNTCIHYQYRDAANYKQAGSIILSGLINQGEISELYRSLDSEGFFVPTLVGLPHLLNRASDAEIDHPFHTIEDIAPTDQPPTDPRSISRFLADFQKADWAQAA